MFPGSRVTALTAALLAGTITAGLMLIPADSTPAIVLWSFILTSSVSFILIYITLEFLFFREIKKMYGILEKLNRRDILMPPDIGNVFNPIKRISREIFAFVMGKQQEIEQLKQLAAFRREFLADVSHELKTPVFAAQGFIHTLLDGAMEDKKVRQKFLKKAARSLDRLDTLISDLLTISSMEAGQITMNYRKFDIKETVKEVFDQLERKSKKKNITLSLNEAHTDPVFVNADPYRIAQVMINLISNAVKYGDEGGEAEVVIRSVGEEVEIAVKDNGPGIPSDHLERIFERFYRVEKSRSKDMGGSGLGLAIVKHIIDAHNSSIIVQSKADKGTVFSFKLKKA